MLIWFFRDPELFAGDDIPGAKIDPGSYYFRAWFVVLDDGEMQKITKHFPLLVDNKIGRVD